MARKWLTALDLTKNEVQNAAFQVLGTAPSSPVKGQFYFDDTGKALAYWDGTAWQTAKSGTGGPPTGTAGGDLTGTYPNPTIGTGKVTSTHILDGTIVDTDVAAANKDGANGTYSLRRLGNAAGQAMPGVTTLDLIPKPVAYVDMNNFGLMNVPDPWTSTEAANKKYVDYNISVRGSNPPVLVASTANVAGTYVPGSGPPNGSGQMTGMANTLDGVSLTSLSRILLKNQTNQKANGIWEVQSAGSGANGVWVRPFDFTGDNGGFAGSTPNGAYTGRLVFVDQGTNADQGFLLSTNGAAGSGAIVIDGPSGANLVWVQVAGSGLYPVDGPNGTPSLRTLSFLAGAAMPGNTALNGITAPTGALGMNGKQIVSLADPSSAQDAATKAYVDSVAQGLDAKQSVRLASDVSIGGGSAPGTNLTVDGVATVQGDRVLLKNQSNPQFNGIYTVNAVSTWNRATDADTWNELPGAYVWVEEGTVNADTGWVCTVNAGGTLGTTAVAWTQFAGAGAGITQAAADVRYVNASGGDSMSGSYVITGAGSGLTAPQGVISANQLNATDTVSATGVDLSGSGAYLSVGGSFSSVTFTNLAAQVVLPAITPTATNHAVTKAYADGLVTGVAKKYSIGCSAATSTVVTHGIGTRVVQVQVYRNSGAYDQVECDVEHTDTATVTVRFATAPTAGEYQIVVIG